MNIKMIGKLVSFSVLLIAVMSSLGLNAQGVITAPKKSNKSSTQSHASSTKSTSRNNVSISEPDGYINGHGYVDLGLPSGLKWATCNVGASSPKENGSYYAWGETKPKSIYTERNSLVVYGMDINKLKHNGIINSSEILNLSNDAANFNWGSTWRMPTEAEYQELYKNCKWEEKIVNGVWGYYLTGPNNKRLFIPCSGYFGDELYDKQGGGPWSSSNFQKGYVVCAHYFRPTTIDDSSTVGSYYWQGRPVRPVSE